MGTNNILINVLQCKMRHSILNDDVLWMSLFAGVIIYDSYDSYTVH